MDQDGAKIVIRLRGEPEGKGRHRARIARARTGAAFVQTYADPATAKYESHLRYAAQQAMAGRALFRGALDVTVIAFRSIPTSMPAFRQEQARQRIFRPTTKPDWDNLAKITDALNGVVWADDAQIVDGQVRKFYADEPELVIVVRELPAPPDYVPPRRAPAPAQPALALEPSS